MAHRTLTATTGQGEERAGSCRIRARSAMTNASDQQRGPAVVDVDRPQQIGILRKHVVDELAQHGLVVEYAPRQQTSCRPADDLATLPCTAIGSRFPLSGRVIAELRAAALLQPSRATAIQPYPQLLGLLILRMTNQPTHGR